MGHLALLMREAQPVWSKELFFESNKQKARCSAGRRIRAIAVCFPYFTGGYIGDGHRSQFRSVIEAFNFKDIAALIQEEKDRIAAEEQKRRDAMQKVKEAEDQRKKDEKTKVKPGVGAGAVTAPVIKK